MVVLTSSLDSLFLSLLLSCKKSIGANDQTRSPARSATKEECATAFSFHPSSFYKHINDAIISRICTAVSLTFIARRNVEKRYLHLLMSDTWFTMTGKSTDIITVCIVSYYTNTGHRFVTWTPSDTQWCVSRNRADSRCESDFINFLSSSCTTMKERKKKFIKKEGE